MTLRLPCSYAVKVDLIFGNSIADFHTAAQNTGTEALCRALSLVATSHNLSTRMIYMLCAETCSSWMQNLLNLILALHQAVTELVGKSDVCT